MRLLNKTVFVTDADSVTGKALIRRLAAEGARLVVNSESGGAAIADELASCRAGGGEAFTATVDLCDCGQVNRLLDEAEQAWGVIDVLVHNPRLVIPATVEHCDDDTFERILDANAKSAFIVSQTSGRRMAAEGRGVIVFVGSIHAEKPTGSSFAYSAAKGAVQMLSRELALALGRHGIRVNHIQLGPLAGDNEVFRSDISTLYEDYQYKVPGTELVTGEDLAGLVAYLAGDEARHLNGADIRLDGGFLNHYQDVKMNKP